MKRDVITLIDGTEVPADDFWLYAPTWMILKYAEPIGGPPPEPDQPEAKPVTTPQREP
jgi:hypothetical protein